MARIGSMVSSTYMMYNMAQKNGLSLFGSSSNSGFNPYSVSSAMSSASNVISGLYGINTSKKELVSSYDKTSKQFYNEFDATMKNLKDSASNLRKTDFKVGEDAVTTIENDDGTTTTKKSDALVKALKSVKDFASDYNDAIDFFSDNKEISKSRMERIGSMFSDTTYRSDTYRDIGINVNAKTGKMTIDEDKLTKAITEKPDRVADILNGRGGLVSKAENHVSQANSERDRLFPSMQSMLGSQFKSASMYSGNSLLSISQHFNVGNLLNMWA
ncbi:MAG: flagellar filament capping protein FliD [Schwartzia sp.]|nr:flagellar filament capping protein FliD [Schwartzia sp. (in: firmicutes)]